MLHLDDLSSSFPFRSDKYKYKDLEFSFSIPGLFQTWISNKHGFEKLNSRFELELSKKTMIKWEKSSKPKTNSQQLLRNKLKLQLKYEVNLRFETQIWKPGPDLKMKNLEMRSWIPGLNLEKNCLKPGNGHFLVYFNKSFICSEWFLAESKWQIETCFQTQPGK